MTTKVFTEGRHAAEFLMSEAAGMRSRETVTIASGLGVIAAGTIIGAMFAAGALSAAVDGSGNTGNGALTMAGTPLGSAAVPGDYRVTLIEEGANAGDFLVETPTGESLGVAEVGVAFTSAHVNFTIADGATDFAAGDLFVITVSESGVPGSNLEYAPSDPAATDGSQVARAITLYEVDTTDGAVDVAVIARDAEVNGKIVTYHADRNTAALKAAANNDLAAHGIIVR